LSYESTPELADSLVLGGGAQFKRVLESNPPHAHIFRLLLLHTRKQFIHLRFKFLGKILNLNFIRRMIRKLHIETMAANRKPEIIIF
jgi:hypothetical protein